MFSLKWVRKYASIIYFDYYKISDSKKEWLVSLTKYTP